jgi:hypothetical protein
MVQQAIDALYESPAVKDMEGVVSNLTAQVRQSTIHLHYATSTNSSTSPCAGLHVCVQLQDLGPLLDAWDIETFDKVQTGQLLNVLTKFEFRNNEVSTVLLSNSVVLATSCDAHNVCNKYAAVSSNRLTVTKSLEQVQNYQFIACEL